MVQSGLRAYIAPMFRSARWYTPLPAMLWNATGTKAGEEAGMGARWHLIDKAEARAAAETGMLVPAQGPTPHAELLRR